MLPMFEKEICEKHNWSNSDEILDYYSVSQMTPGVIAVNVATFVGHKERGILGGIVSTLGVISPSLLIICLIATFLSNINTIPVVQSLLKGLASGVCALIVPSIIKFSKKSIKDIYTFLIFAICFIIFEFTNIQTVFVVIAVIILSILISIFGGKK